MDKGATGGRFQIRCDNPHVSGPFSAPYWRAATYLAAGTIDAKWKIWPRRSRRARAVDAGPRPGAGLSLADGLSFFRYCPLIPSFELASVEAVTWNALSQSRALFRCRSGERTEDARQAVERRPADEISRSIIRWLSSQLAGWGRADDCRVIRLNAGDRWKSGG